MKDVWRKVGIRLCKKRLMNGFSQRDLMEALELKDTSRISRWERGLEMPGERYRNKLCVLYKTMYDELFYELRQEAVQAIEKYYKKVEARKLKAMQRKNKK